MTLVLKSVFSRDGYSHSHSCLLQFDTFSAAALSGIPPRTIEGVFSYLQGSSPVRVLVRVGDRVQWGPFETGFFSVSYSGTVLAVVEAGVLPPSVCAPGRRVTVRPNDSFDCVSYIVATDDGSWVTRLPAHVVREPFGKLAA
jgi:hypothetical protein